MKNSLFSSCIKGFLVGISFGMGVMVTTAIGVTVSSTFSSGDTLTAVSLNVLKTAIESIPEWTKSGGDAVYTAGNVGINDSAPDGKFEVNPDGTEDNGDEFVVNASGYVGIGTSNPQSIFAISGLPTGGSAATTVPPVGGNGTNLNVCITDTGHFYIDDSGGCS
jgi:hypothetical protein